MADRPSYSPTPGPMQVQAPAGRPTPDPSQAGSPPFAGLGHASSAKAGTQRARSQPVPGTRPTPSLGSGLPGRAALAGLIAALDLEPAVGLAIVDAQARPLHANRRFGALTVPEQAGLPATPGALVPRKGVWALLGPDLVARVLAEGRPAVLRFIHEGAQVHCTVWPIEIGASAADSGEPEATERGPLLLVLAVEGLVAPNEERQPEVQPSASSESSQVPAAAAQTIEPKPAHGFITMSAMLAEFGPMSSLTSRELEVLALIGQGLATREIAEALGRSPRTVERHCDAIHKKLGTTNRVQMARYAMRAGLTIEAGKLKRV